MRSLTPEFVLEAAARGATHGRLQAVTLFADVSGFTPLTTRLVQYGSEGAEVLSDVLAALFEPLTSAITAHGGVVVGYAGDAFKAIFPITDMHNAGDGDAYAHAAAAAWAIVQHFRTQPAQVTRFGAFEFSGKVCLADGAVEWRLLGTERRLAAATAQRAGIVFGGEAIAASMQLDPYAHRGEVVVSAACYAKLAPQPAATWRPVEDMAWRLEHWPGLAEPEPEPEPETRQTTQSAEWAVSAKTLFPPEVLDSPVAGEFRRVVTLFINCALDAAELDRLHFPDLLFELLDQYGGFLCRIGRTGSKDDGLTLLVFFGAPKGQEHDVAQALHFALQLRERAPVALRAGITTSLAFAGFVGSSHLQEYTCHGPLVNLAARLMTTAPPGALWLDAATVRSAGPGWDVEPLGEQPFKGFAEPQPVFALHGHSSAAPFYVGDLVGRTRELQALQAAAQPLWQGQNGGLALVVGEAGLGKSRLVHTFQGHTQLGGSTTTAATDATAGSPNSAQWFVCQTDEIVRAPFNPFRYWLREYFHQQAQQDEGSNLLALAEWLSALVANVTDPQLAADLEHARAPLAALLDLPVDDPEFEQLDARLRFDNTLDAVKTLIKAESLRRPVILLIEDGQWLDEESKTLLGRLLNNVDGFPFLVIVAARPEAEFTADAPAPPWLPEAVPLRLLRLVPLEDSDAVALAEARLGGRPTPHLAAFLAEQSEGFPFFLEQLLLYLQERNLLGATPQGWDFTAAAAAQKETLLPGDVRSVLTARLDRLPLDVRLAVQTAGVLGREFDTRVLGHMLDDAPDLPQLLAAADAAGIWTCMAEARYLFRHSLLREAAYDMQLRTRLRRLHLRATHAIETVYAADLGPQYAALVYHSNRAEAFDKERSYAHLAGSYAADHYANNDAVRFFSRALELTPSEAAAEIYDLLTAREKTYDVLGERGAQQADLDALAQVVSTKDDAYQRTQYLLRRSTYDRVTAQYDRALAAADEVIGLAQQGGYDDLERAGLHLRGRILLMQGHMDESRQCIAAALESAAAHAQLHVQANCLYDLANIIYVQAEYETATSYLDQARALFQSIRDAQGETRCYMLLANVTYRQGQYDRSIKYIEQGLALTRTTGWKFGETFLRGSLGNAYFDLGSFVDAEDCFQQVLYSCRELQDKDGEGASLDTLGLIDFIRGLEESASGHYQSALQIQQQIGDKHGEAYTLTHRGHLFAVQGYFQAALADFTRAKALREELGEEDAAVDSKAGMAYAMWRLGNQGAALETALEVYQQMEQSNAPAAEIPVQVWLICHTVFANTLELDDARSELVQVCLDRAYGLILDRAERIADAAMRRSYLQHGYLNGEVLRLYAQAQVAAQQADSATPAAP